MAARQEVDRCIARSREDESVIRWLPVSAVAELSARAGQFAIRPFETIKLVYIDSFVLISVRFARLFILLTKQFENVPLHEHLTQSDKGVTDGDVTIGIQTVVAEARPVQGCFQLLSTEVEMCENDSYCSHSFSFPFPSPVIKIFEKRSGREKCIVIIMSCVQSPIY